MNIADIKKVVQAIGFSVKSGATDIWHKKYANHNGYEIELDLSKPSPADCTIDYGSGINKGRTTTSTFHQPETLVVVECVDRLLSIGYKPNTITVEKVFGVATSDIYLDILVSDNTNLNNAYLMIECKTFGKGHKVEHDKMLDDGGQLFGYFVQERNAKFLCLYSSQLDKTSGQIEKHLELIETSRLQGNSKIELHESWDKSFFKTGLFDIGCQPYNVQELKLRKKDLEDLKEGDSIFNAFAEILRRHVISDKPNAFNKIFNLFICKIQDEEKADDEILDFQWVSGEDNVDVLNRLNDLYKKGMEQYLELSITDYSQDEIDQQLNALTGSNKANLRNMLIELRLYKNNEFAFKEVVNKKTFDENCAVIRDVVKLLQNKKIRYATKQQFLGDFFEKLLNTSVKQESGQYFTPIPITRFICDSLPLKPIIDKKIGDNNPKFLPYVIDFASGSGHFLTESMERIDQIVKAIPESGLKLSQKQNLSVWKQYFKWANEFVYGIEKDYRLAKTTKISCFLNGDGEANIIYADGLDHFGMSSSYKGGVLEVKMETDEHGNLRFDKYSKLNQKFDVLVANPPYSVPGFKRTINYGESSFDLYPKLSDEKSKEIECLFIERAKQLLVTEGVSGIILPISVLTNGGIYSDTRKILLKAFKIKGIVEFGGGTFMATSTNTIVLFLERRKDNDAEIVENHVNQFFKDFKDLAVLDIEKPFSNYCSNIRDADISTYKKFLQSKLDDVDLPEWVMDYHESFNGLPETTKLKEQATFKKKTDVEQLKELNTRLSDYIKAQEAEKALFYLLLDNQQTVIVSSPSKKKDEKNFLGYEFSNRRGSEGIKIFKDKSKNIKSMLYSDTTTENPAKINYYIRQSFANNLAGLSITDEVSKHLQILNVTELIDFNRPDFGGEISLSVIQKKEHWDAVAKKVTDKDWKNIGRTWKPFKLGDLPNIVVDSGSGAPQGSDYFEMEKDANGNDSRKLFVRVSSLKNADINSVVSSDSDSMVNSKATTDYKLKQFKSGTIVFPKSGKAIETNKIAKLGCDCFVVNHLATIWLDDKDISDYVFKYLKHFKTSNLAARSGYPTIGVQDIKRFKIPVPIKADGTIDLAKMKVWASKI